VKRFCCNGGSGIGTPIAIFYLNTGIVNQDIQFAVFVIDIIKCMLNIGCIGYIQLEEFRIYSFFL